MRIQVQRLIVILLALMMLPVSAQEDETPLAEVLTTMDVPRRDRVQLALELLGVEDIPQPPTTPAVYAVGDRRVFSVNDNEGNVENPVTAELYALGEHIAIWVDVRADGSRTAAQTLAREFDTVIYPKMRAVWGEERTPGIDGDPRVVALFSYDISNSVAAYYASQHSLPKAVVPDSNEAEMMMYNINAYGLAFDSTAIYSVTAHEFQHMIRDNIEGGADTWLNEGFSIFSEWMMDYYSLELTFMEHLFAPLTQLNTWESTGANYGTAGLFVTYLFERYGYDGVTALNTAHGAGMGRVDAALETLGAAEDANTFYADFVAATWLQDSSGATPWGYPHVQLFEPASRTLAGEYPQTFESATRPYAVQYLKLRDAQPGQTLDITVDFAEDARLAPLNAENGAFFWMAMRQDNSAPTLTHAFDLRNVTEAMLEYRVWFDFELDYDFGYLMVSADSGATWDVLNPLFAAGNSLYGTGYTGLDGVWRFETVSLNDYAGQEILVRFMVITDDALNSPGMMIDDVRIDAIGYADDFESDGGDWDARGWLLTDNRVSAQIMVQALIKGSYGVSVQRLLASAGDTLRVDIPDDAQFVALALSPMIPISTENLPYVVTVTTP